MKNQSNFSRRDFLLRTALAGASLAAPRFSHAQSSREKLPVAGIATIYKRNTHADVVFGKILEGYDQQGGPGPGLKLVSLYIDQSEDSVLGIEMAKKYGVPVFKTIEEAVTVGGKSIPVAGVLSVGEHGDYPKVEKTGQKMYPRRRLFDGIANTFRKYRKVVPVFSDKHLSYAWAHAKHMHDTAVKMKIPFMAGSSVPVAWRRPELVLPRGCNVTDAMGIGYGGAEPYGFHALEGLQCMIERRKGGETGVQSVQAITGDAIWKAEKEGRWSRDLLMAAINIQPQVREGAIEQRLKANSPFYLIEYRDGLRATLAMMNGVCRHFSCAVKRAEQPKPDAVWFELDEEKPYGHFAWLLQAIEHMIRTGQPAYPVERTLLTTGILDRAMHSMAEGGKRYNTPELNIRYQPTDWGFAKGKFPTG